jgi:subtilisin-like proprotein convertase family protein
MLFVTVLSPGDLLAQSKIATAVGPEASTIPTNELLIFLNPGQSAASIGEEYGLTLVGSLANAPQIVRLDASSVATAARVVRQMEQDARIRQAFVLAGNRIQSRSFTPNDPYFNPGQTGNGNTTNRLFPGQWHLHNQMPSSSYNDPTIHANVLGAWNRNLTGSGVVIGIVDDAVQVSHEDLSPNNIPELSRYFLPNGTSQADPNPQGTTSIHGTSVAGIAVARGGNEIGVTGAAPLAGLAGIRTEYNSTALLNAYTWRNDAIRIKNHSYGYTTPYVNNSAAAAVIAETATHATHPVIHVWAAGNERGELKADANTDSLTASPHVITVAALGSKGKYASYSCFGASVFVTAPSSTSSSEGFDGTTTTDLVGTGGYNDGLGGSDYSNNRYTNYFGGTSSAAPLVSGVLALAVQARTEAGFTSDVRVLRHLLARTSRVVDASDSTPESDGGWRTNAAGFKFNQNYGFGLIDADALTAAAVQYSGVTEQVTHTKSTTNVNQTIPDNNATGISRSFEITSSGKLESVLVTLNITHSYRGDLEAYITSPSGYRSRLMYRDSADSGNNINWTYQTVAFWGEEVQGTWTITVTDRVAQDIGIWNSYAVTFYTGDLIPVPEPTMILGIGVGVLVIRHVLRRRDQSNLPTLAG